MAEHPLPFIVLEGIDGSGKSTLGARLVEYLRSKDIGAYLTEAPRPGLRGGLAMTADRMHHLRQIRADRIMGAAVVCDRFAASTLAYQPGEMEQANHDLLTIPTHTLYLDVPVPTALKRIRERGGAPDPYETRENLRKVSAAYAKVPWTLCRNFAVIDATKTPDEVFAAALPALGL